jgi:HPt (histidine-containing phosphotransfer) domain-containing protein
MNFKVQAEKMGLDEEEYVEIVNLFIKTAADNLCQMRSAVETGDASKIHQETHSLKGAALVTSHFKPALFFTQDWIPH